MKLLHASNPVLCRLVAGYCIALTSIVSVADDGDIGKKALTDLEYKREVLGYCGLSDPLAVKGFLARKQTLIRDFVLNEQVQFDAISDARQAAYAEWQNRGLGGFRGWCREEGSDYTSRLKSYVKTH